MRTILSACLFASFALMTVPAVHGDALVGASGQCYDDFGNGGGTSLVVDQDGNLLLPDAGPLSAGVRTFALGGGSCSDPNAPGYIEVHAQGMQVCYENGAPVIDGSCPTSPPGP